MATFQFYDNYWQALSHLGDEDLAAVVRAMCSYAFDGTEPGDLQGIPAVLFPILKPGIDSSIQNIKNGKKGGRPRKKPVEDTGVSETQKPPFLESEKGGSEKAETKRSEAKQSEANKNKAKRFVKPTVEEVEAYVREKGYPIDAVRFVDYYESVGWVIGKGKKMQDWRRAVNNWAARQTGDSSAKYRRSDEPAAYAAQPLSFGD